MALEAGGYAEKFGNSYEANWVTYQLLQLLCENILSVSVEPIGDDEEGVDVIIEHHSNKKEFHQCKASNGDNEHWTLSSLYQAKILTKAFFQIQRDGYEFHIVSPLPCKMLTDLRSSALNTTSNATDFYEYQIKISEPRIKTFNNLCKYLEFDTANNSDLRKAKFFLQRFVVTPYSHTNVAINEAKYKANTLFSDSPDKLLSFLKTYPVSENRLRGKITLHSLLQDLKIAGFQQRIIPADKRITPILQSVSQAFEESIKPFLISDQVIPRNELDQVVKSMDTHAITLIQAEAGMGKSALMLELHNKLTTSKAISVPIRLDRNKPEDNADAFGKKLGFPYSPALCLSQYAKDTKTVLILDQLDAVRWTGSHSNNALQVCQELVRQVLSLRQDGIDINIILTCRDFDLDDDVALNSWISSLADNVTDIKLTPLNTADVTQLIKPYEEFDALPEEKQTILTTPLWLNIYLTIAEKNNSAPQFTNKLELVKDFWDNRIEQVIDYGVSRQEANDLINEIVVLATSRSTLSIPENLIAISSPNTLKALLSSGILTKQLDQISFRHQALFDYQVGIRLYKAAISSPNQLIPELGDRAQQTLTKREHLKYSLNMLLQSNQRLFCSNVLQLLKSEAVRFHLKYLVFNSIKELETLKAPAREMIIEIASNSELQSHFIAHSCNKNHHIIKCLSDAELITSWLRSEDTALIGNTLFLLRSISETAPHIVLKELKPFIGESEEWNTRVYSGLSWDVENDSDEMFETRKHLISLGCNAGFIQWKGLAKKTPHRALDLFEMLLQHYKEVLCATKYSRYQKIDKLTHRDTWSNTELDELSSISLAIPHEAVSRLLSILNCFAEEAQSENNEEYFSYIWFSADKFHSHDPEQFITLGVFSIIENAALQLRESHQDILDLLAPYLLSQKTIINNLISILFLQLPINCADRVIRWQLDNARLRFTCGNTNVEPEWILPGKLIEKFSPHCSSNLFQLLENQIYGFGLLRDLEDAKWKLDGWKRNIYYSYWGEAQHFLLPMLSPNRISQKSKQLIEVLKRKFAGYSESRFCSNDSGRGGWVTSPLPQGNTLTDNAWRKLILTPREKMNKKTWSQVRNDVITESSIQQFSSSLESTVRNQPLRFAKLALTLPSDIEKQYRDAFYRGLSQTKNDNIHKNYIAKWEICPPEITEEVINHFKNNDSESSLLRLFESRICEPGWSKEAKTLLVDLAFNAVDPKPDTLNLVDINKDETPGNADISSLRNNALNCNRGVAYRAISRLLWDDLTSVNNPRGIIQAAIDDPHPAVNIASLSLLLPMLNHDNKFSHQNFILLCNKDLRMTRGREAYHFFNNGFTGDHREDYVQLVMKMLQSPIDEIRKEAAKQIFARWFFYDLFQDEIDSVINGDKICRKAVANVVTSFLKSDLYHEHLHKLPAIYEQLVNDEEKEVLNLIGGCVRDENFWNKEISNELFNTLVSSKAILLNLYSLFDTIADQPTSLLEYKEQLLLLVENITTRDRAEIAAGAGDMYIQDTSLIKVLQRLYDEATEDEDTGAINICLDIWDKLLHSNLYSAINASKKLDKGLLN